MDPQNAAVDQYIYMHRNWETHIGELIARELKAGDVFVDIGANIGYFSLLAAQLVGKSGAVYGFEPIARVAKQFARSVQANDHSNVFVRQLALGNAVAQMQLSIMPGNVGGSSLVKQIDSGLTETVQVSTLDREIGSQKVDFIKIDVEGYEYEVLLGARHVLATYAPKLVLEFSPRVYARRDPTIARSILELLRNLGYTIYDIEQQRIVEDIDSYIASLNTEQTNLFATAAR